MTRPSERELRNAVESLDETGDDMALSDVCCSWKDDCEHDEHVIVADFTDTDT